MPKVIVTGGSGFIGTNLVELLLAQDCEVLSLDIAPPRYKKHTSSWKKLDILNWSETSEVFMQFNPDYCFHLAARTDLDGAHIGDYHPNTIGVANVVEALKKCVALRHAVFASSMLVCPLGYVPRTEDDYKPETLYGKSKVLGEQIIKNLENGYYPWTIVRPTSIWGPWFCAPYFDFFKAVASRKYFHPGKTNAKRSYGFVLNTVRQLFSILGCDRVFSKTIYLADVEPICIKDWADSISNEFHGRNVKSLPLPLFKILAFSGDCLAKVGYTKFPMTSFRLNNMLTSSVYDLTEFESLVKVNFISMADGVKITCDWLREQGL